MSNTLSSRKIGPHFFYKLYCFYFVVHCGSYVKASEYLHIGRPSLTRIIQSLEARLKVCLLYRKTQSPLRLSSEGAEVLRCSKQLVEILHILEQSLALSPETLTEDSTLTSSPILYSSEHLSELFKGLSLCFSEYSSHDGVIKKLNQYLKKDFQDRAMPGVSKEVSF